MKILALFNAAKLRCCPYIYHCRLWSYIIESGGSCIASYFFTFISLYMKKHILLVDDDREELSLFMDALREVPGSYKCTYSDSAIHALEMLNYLHPDFIFLDYNLPDIDGVELIARIKKDRKLNNIPLFLYSSVISKEKDNAAMSLGVTACIQKPGTIGEMSAILKSVFLALGEPAQKG